MAITGLWRFATEKFTGLPADVVFDKYPVFLWKKELTERPKYIMIYSYILTVYHADFVAKEAFIVVG